MQSTIDATREYERRFPTGARLEALMWMRIEASCANWHSGNATDAARAYLHRFPDGPHATDAKTSSVCSTIH